MLGETLGVSHSWIQLLIQVCLVHSEAVTLKLTSNMSREGCITAVFHVCSKFVVKLVLCNLGKCCMIVG